MRQDETVDDAVTIPPIQFDERGVQPVHATLLENLKKLRWDDLRLMSVFSDQASLRSASRVLGVSVNTVRARLERIEQTLEHQLFFRSAMGLRLTDEGALTLRVAQQMRRVSEDQALFFPDEDTQPNVLVKLSCSEGLAGFWLAPRLHELRVRLPYCTFDLAAEADQSRVHDRGYDISIGFARPKDPNCIAARLGTAHVMLFCSRGYAAQFGIPDSIDALEHHHFIAQSNIGLNPESAALIGGENLVRRRTTLTVNSSFALYSAVMQNLGIGALPTYATALSPHVVAIDLPVNLRFDIWMSYDPRMKDRVVTRQCIEWARQCFDPDIYPWFGERFIHPREIDRDGQSGQLLCSDSPLFEWFR